MKQKKWFAFIPYYRYVMTNGRYTPMGIYWLRPITLTWTLWNGWTAFSDDND